MIAAPRGVELGLGLIGIGRPWPDAHRPLPPDDRVERLFEAVVELGIRFLDTAAAYGRSEERLGSALRGPLRPYRDQLIVATKCGENWADGVSTVDHSPAALEHGVARSIRRLGRIDLLQLHKATPEVLTDLRVLDTLTALATRYGIAALGVSARDEATCRAAVDTGLFAAVQCPFNAEDQGLTDWIKANRDRVTVVVNRPLGSGRLLAGASPADLYTHVAETLGHGVVLTGTTDAGHLAHSAGIFDLLAKGRLNPR